MNSISFSKHVGIMGITQGLIQARTLFLLPLLTKVLGAFYYGLWTQVMVTTEFFLPIISLSLHGALIRFLASKKSKSDIQEGFYSLTSIVIGISVLVCIGITIFATPIANRFFGNNVLVVHLLTIIVFVQSVNIMLLSYLRTFKKIGTYCFFLLFDSYGALLLIFIGLSMHLGIIWAIWSVIVIRVFIFVILTLYIFSQIGFTIPKFLNIKEYFSFSLPSVPSNISGWFVQLSDRYVIAYFIGLSAVGYYSPAYTLGGMLMLFIDPFAIVLTPYVSDAYDNQRIDEVKLFLGRTIKFIIISAFPLMVCISILSKPLLTLLSTSEIASHAYSITPFIAASLFLYGFVVVASEVLSLVKKTKIIAITWIISGILNVLLNILLVPKIGIFAAAITTFVSYLFVVLILWNISKRYILITISWQTLIKCLLISMPFFLILLFQPNSLIFISLVVFCSALYYFLMLRLFNIISKEEMFFLRSLLVR